MKSHVEYVLQRKAIANFRKRSPVRIRNRKASRDITLREKLCRSQRNRCAGTVERGVYVPCFRFITAASAECDHIIELQYGGHDAYFNLQLLCRPCHRRKTSLNRLSPHAH